MDIVDRLNKYAASMGTRNPKDYITFLTVEEVTEAAEIIKALRSAVHKIGFDFVELSHEKVQVLYLEHIKLAREAYEKSFKQDKKEEDPVHAHDWQLEPNILLSSPPQFSFVCKSCGAMKRERIGS